MKSTHIAFFSFPFFSNVGPTLPIVAVLVRRGYRVTYVTSKQFSPRASAVGAEVVLCPDLFECTSQDDPLRLTRLAALTLEQTVPFYEANRPALIVYDHCSAGRVLADKWGIPGIQTSPVFAHERTIHNQQIPDSGYRNLWFTFAERMDRGFRELGIASRDFLFYRERLNIYLYPKVLQPCADAIDDSCFYAGRCAGEQPHYGSWNKNVANERPMALVSTSTLYVRGPEYFKMCVEALTGLQWHVILSIGDSGDAAALQPLPPNFEIVQHTAHVKILPHISLFICLGGNITAAEAMYHGVPMIVTTHGKPELEYQADNLVRLGIARHLRDANTNAESLREAAVQVSADAEMLTRVRKLQRVVRRDPGAEETANRIEEYLETYS